MNTHSITFYFDFLSPFSYLAWINVHRLQEELRAKGHELSITYKPVLMTTLFQAFGIKAPGEVKSKREFLLRQMCRYTKARGIPFMSPKTHPFNPLYVLRMALLENAGDKQWAVCDAIWKSGWQDSVDLGNPDDVIIALDHYGVDGRPLLERTSDRVIKQALKTNCDEAIGEGVFGVPSFIVNGELFWGNDSLPDVERALLGIDLLDRDHYNELRSRITLP